MSLDDNEPTGRAKGGFARRDALTAEQRRKSAQKAATARWDADLPMATHEGKFDIGKSTVACAVLPNGSRIITQATFLRVLGRSPRPTAGTGVLAARMPPFLQAEVLQPYVSEDLVQSTMPIFYRTQTGGKAVGYDARLLPQVADVYLRFRDAALADKGAVPVQYKHIIKAADLLMRALANVGIIALVDEATGYQRDRSRDALARILEEFIAKELRPWVRTFPDAFYEHLFRLRGLVFPRDTVKKPQYFGHLTNDIIYKRLAPGVLEELKKSVPRQPNGSRLHLHRKLSENVGHPKLREHLASVITLMKITKDEDYDGFIELLDKVHPRFDEVPLLAYLAENDQSGL